MINKVISRLFGVILIGLTIQSCGSDNNQTQGIKNQKSEQENIEVINKNIDTIPNDVKPIKNKNLLFEIEGNYRLKDDVANCKIELSLFLKNEVLKYNMITNTRNLSGIAEIVLNERKDGYYITFKNIEWSEYLGAIDAEGETSEEELPLPQDVEGVLYKNEITIQNYGNAMNYFVKLGECDVKYIYLTKEF